MIYFVVAPFLQGCQQMDNDRVWKRIVAASTFATALMLFHYIEIHDIGETNGGTLTGPFLLFGHLGSITLAISAFVIFKRQRLAFSISVIAMMMPLPWFSFDLWPSFWCSKNCYPGGYQFPPNMIFRPDVFWLLTLFVLTLFLQRRAFIK